MALPKLTIGPHHGARSGEVTAVDRQEDPRQSGGYDMGDFYRQLLPAMWSGCRLRCPVCHKGRIFRSLLQVNERCPNCGIVFEPDSGDFAGALMLAMGVTGLVVALGALALELTTHVSAETQVVIWTVFACTFLPFGYASFKGAWYGFLHTLRRMK